MDGEQEVRSCRADAPERVRARIVVLMLKLLLVIHATTDNDITKNTNHETHHKTNVISSGMHDQS